MTSVKAVDDCRRAYEAYFNNLRMSGSSEGESVESCAHYFLDGKPVNKKFTPLIRSTAFWDCQFWKSIADECFGSEPVTLALGRSLHFGMSNAGIFEHLLRHAPETLKRGIRYSQIFLNPQSKPWQEILTVAVDTSGDFLQFLRVCHRLYEELQLHEKSVKSLQAELADLTVFEFLLYSSLFAFHSLVPERLDLTEPDEQLFQIEQAIHDALNQLLVWKIQTRDDNDFRLNEWFLARSLKQHLIPLLLPDAGNPTICHRNLNLFTALVKAVVNKNDFLHQTISDFCFDDDYRYKFDGDHLTLYPIEIPEESDWDFNGRKYSALHRYWFNRALIDYALSDLVNQQFGLPENEEANRLAYIKACQVYLQLDEVFGLDPEIRLPDGTCLDLFKALHSLELMTAFFNVSYVAEFRKHYQATGNCLSALSLLMLEGIMIGENRFPLTWAEPSEKALRIMSWTVSDSHPDGNESMARAILEFWSNDLALLKAYLKKNPNMPTPELHERPIINLGKYGFQLPWLMASQNNSTAAINNLRRIGSRRISRMDETQQIESRLGDLLREMGFAVVHSYRPRFFDVDDPGEVDLLCYLDGYLLILEVKSSYIRKTKQEAWIHRTGTLRKASRQLHKKQIAVEIALRQDLELLSCLGVTIRVDEIKIHPWIVDTSIEHDQSLIDGYLKVSLEGLIVILMNERQLLTSIMEADNEIHADDLFPDGFSAKRFVEVVEGGELWSILKETTR